ncbi:MAG: phenylalanine 4-monooxygenase, partial [Pseudomonadota bacterium]
RIGFDLKRLMRTDYRIDDFQQTYFVIESYEQLFRATVDTDFAPLYAELQGQFDLRPEDVLETDDILTHGSQAYANAGGRFVA